MYFYSSEGNDSSNTEIKFILEYWKNYWETQSYIRK